MEEKCQKQNLTNAEVSSLNKSLHKIVLYSVKVVPVIIAGIYLLNTMLSYIGIDAPALSYITQFLFIYLLYILSYVFKFCEYHRMFIHYILLILVLNIIDYHWGIPLENRGLFLLYGIVTGVFLFIILYLHQKEVKRRKRLLQ